MNMKKDPLKAEIDDQLKKDPVSKEKDPKAQLKEQTAAVKEASTPVKEPNASAPIMANVNEVKAIKESIEIKKPEKIQMKEPIITQMQKDQESNQAKAPGAFQTQQKKEPDISKYVDHLEEKISRRIEEVKKVNTKIKETDEDIEEIQLKRRKETMGEKVKKIALFGPKICVEANVCRFPKALCKGCGKMEIRK